MPKNINTPRSELICGMLGSIDSLDEELMRRGLTSILYLTADIRRDAERMEAKLVSRKCEVEKSFKEFKDWLTSDKEKQ